MKNSIHLLSIVLIPLLSSAQTNEYHSLLQQGKEWNYDVAYYEGYGNDMVRKHSDFKIWIDGDTIISDKRCFKIRTSMDGVASSYLSLWYEDAFKVYYYNNITKNSFVEYDFGMTVGEDASSWGQGPFEVMRVDSVLVVQKPRKRIVLQRPDGETVPWIEGVGNPGLLEEPLGHMVSDGIVYTLLSCYENGECIFETKDFCSPPYTVDTTLDRQWHYIDKYIDNHGKGFPDMNSQQTMWTTHKKQQREGKEYDVMFYNRGITPLKEDSILVRWENGRVYAIQEDYERIFHTAGANGVSEYYPCENGEVVLYDFNVEKGDIFGNSTVSEVTVTEDAIVSRKLITLDNGHSIVEGIGSLTGGFFDYMQKPLWEKRWEGWMCCYLDAYEEQEQSVFMQNDMDIYNKIILSVFEMETKHIHKNETIYDLQGRQLHGKPAKGMYIQNGKKYVVK